MFLSGTIYFAVEKCAVVSVSAADDTTYFVICAIAISGPFQIGGLSFSDRKMWAPALFLDFDLLMKPALEWVESTMLLAL